MLTLTIIARNAEGTIERCLRSADPYVDHIVIVFAGESADDTEGVVDRVLSDLRRGADTCDVLHFGPQDNPQAFFPDGQLADFSAARNMALSRVPAGSHWMYLDTDDELIDATPALFEQVTKALDEGRAGVIALPYHYSFDDYGKPTSILNSARIYSGAIDWEWVDRVHEWVKTDGHAPTLRLPAPIIKHARTEKASERNARILELMLQENPENRRAMLHLADAYYGLERWEDARAAYADYYADPELEPHAWHCAAQAAKCSLELSELDDAAQWAMTVVDMRPEFKDGYLLRARVAEAGGYHEKALFWLDQAVNKIEPTNDTSIVVFMHDYTWNAWDCQFRALQGLQRWTEAKGVAALALRHYPENRAWFRQYQLAAEGERIDKSVAALAQLCDHFVRRGDTLNAYRMLADQFLPMTVREDPRVLGLRAQVQDYVKHVLDPVKYREFYDDDTDHRCVGTAVDTYRLQPILESLRRRNVKRVLDVACGQAGPLMWLAERLPGVEFVGLDINRHLVAAAAANVEARGLSDRVTVEHGSAFDYKATHPRDHFDAVTMIELIEHMRRDESARLITQAEELGDAVLMTTPAMFCSDIPGLGESFPRDHVVEFSRSDMEQIVFRVPVRRPVELRKVWAPADEDDETGLVYLYPGFASWFMEFDRASRHRPPVVFFLGQGPGWTPMDIAEKGLGGSETMAVKMAEQFADNHHPVVVYADWVGVHRGVIYRHWSEFRPERPYMGVDAWLFISSRVPSVFDAEKVNADVTWLWAHDVDYGDEVTEERVEKLARVLVVSEWQKRHWLETYPWFPPEKVAVTSNAIDPELFGARPAWQQHRFIWPSSWDRGLDRVLELWPEIRRQWADAELHVFYGSETMDVLATMPGRGWLREFKAKVLELAEQPGVTMHGRVSQPRLLEEMGKSQFWLYPSVTPFGTRWNETFCIAAMEALCMGVTPIVADAGALVERMADVGLKDQLVGWKEKPKQWLHMLRRYDRAVGEEEINRRRRILFESRSFAAVYAQWIKLALEGSLEDQVRGEVQLAESMLVTPT